MFFLVKSKKGVSIFLGYILLVVFVLVLAIIVYQWIQSYVPIKELTCPSGASLIIENYKCSDNKLVLNLRNNGNFNLGGYFVYVTTNPNVNVATVDLSSEIDAYSQLYPTGVKLSGNSSSNSLVPGGRETDTFDLTGIGGVVYSVEITPIRWLKEENRIKLSSCKDAKIKEKLVCIEPCISNSLEETCFGTVCGTRIDNCFDSVLCGVCNDTEVCNANGQCVLPGECNDTCDGYECGEVCGVNCGDCNLNNTISSVCSFNFCVIGGECVEGFADCDGLDYNGCETVLGTDTNCISCNDTCMGTDKCLSGICSSCNGVWNPPEDPGIECDGTPLPAHCLTNCTCAQGFEANETGGCNLIIPESVGDCADYCSLFPGYTDGGCMQNPSQCTGLIPSGTYVGDIPEADPAIGNSFCSIGNADTCCCQP